MFLLTQPPKELKFYPCKPNTYSARGAIVLMEKAQGRLPDLQFYRFDFFLKVNQANVEAAALHLDKLVNLSIESGERESQSWREERQEAHEMVSACIETNGEVDLGDYEAAINYWHPAIESSLDDLKTEDEFKRMFSHVMGDVFVIRHYFETEWVILAKPDPIKINFKDVYKV